MKQTLADKIILPAYFFLSLLGLGLVFNHHLSLVRMEADRATVRDTQFYLPKVSFLKPLLLGHEGLAADLMWIRTLGYTADEVLRRRKIMELEKLVDFITDLDPRFEQVYLWAGAITIYSGGAITKEKIFASNKILEKGWRYILSDPSGWRHSPHYWRIPYMIGFNYAFELRNPKVGAPFIAQAAEIPGSTPILKTYAATLWKKSGDMDKGTQTLETSLLIDYLQGQMEQASDEESRNNIRIRLGLYYKKLYGDKVYLEKLRAFEENIRKILNDWRQNYSELDFGLYLLLFGKSDTEPKVNEPFLEIWSEVNGGSVAHSRESL